MLKLTQELFGGQDATQARGDEVGDGLEVLMDFFTYFAAVVEERKKNPTDDLASILANALVDGEPMEALDQMELLGHELFFVFYNANTNAINVLYKRRDGTYGLLEPQLG